MRRLIPDHQRKTDLGKTKGSLDGGKIVAGTVDYTQLASTAVRDGVVDWPNQGGMSQQVLFAGTATEISTAAIFTATTTATGMVRIHQPIYVPGTANSLEYTYIGYHDSGGVNNSANARVTISTASGDIVSLATTATVPTLSTAGAVDVSTVSGWQTAIITFGSLDGLGATVYLNGLTGRFI